MNKIFVSYRRADSEDVTGRIADHLAARFGAETLFKDVDSIDYGADFRAVIADTLRKCEVVLAIIGPDWAAKKQSGERRIDDPNDYVRLELRSALEHAVPIIPLLIGDAEMPNADSLPEDLRPVAYLNAIKIRPDPDFRGDMERLSTQLAKRLEGSEPLWTRRRAVMAGGATVLLSLAGLLTYPYLLTRTKLRIGLKQWVGYTPLGVAREMRLFPRGIEVEFKDVPTVQEMNDRLRDGDIDVALSVVEAHVRAVEPYAKDDSSDRRPVVFLKIDTSRGADGIVARKEINDVTDLMPLDGRPERRFIYQHHDVSHFLFRHLCNEANIEWRDIKRSADDRDPESAAGLFLKPVDVEYYAAGTYEPHLTELLEGVDGAHYLITTDSEAVRDLVVDVMVSKWGFLNQNKESVAALLEGWFAAVEILNDKAHPRHGDAVDLARRFNGLPKDENDWSVASWTENTPCTDQQYETYVAGLTGKSATTLPWPNRGENIDFFKQHGGSGSRFHSVFNKCAALREGRDLGDLDAGRFDGSMLVFPQD